MSESQEALAVLFPAAVRQKLLVLMFLRPDEAFHGREIARLLGVSPGALSGELAAMTAGGILKRSRIGTHVLYQANRDVFFFKALQGLIQQLAGAVPALRNALQAFVGKLDFVCVFGSIARNEAGPDSDIDLLLVGDQITGRMKAALRVELKDAGRALDIQDFTRAQFAELLEQGSPFVGEVINNPLIMLIGEEDDLKNASRVRAGR